MNYIQLSIRSCPVCSSHSYVKLLKYCPDLLNPGDPTEWSYAKCIECASLFLTNPPSRETIGLAYETYYTHSRSSDQAKNYNINNKRMPSFANLSKLLAISYKQSKGLDAIGGNPFISKLFSILPIGFPLLDRQLRSLNELPKSPQTKVLDVGCGNGSFLLLSQQFGFVSDGVDFDIESVRSALSNQVNVYHGDISTMQELSKEETYDLITFGNSLEHLYDPIQALAIAYRLLKPGGLIWIETPSAHALGLLLFQNLWRGIEAPRHLQIFSNTGLISQLYQLGFKKVDRKRQVSHHGFIQHSYRIALEHGLRPTIELRIKYYLALILSPLVALLNLECSEFILITAEK